jgi:type IV pilus assembly protein PilX
MNNSSSAPPSAPTRQRGMVLVTVLLLLLMVTVLGTAVLRMQTAEQRISVNAGNHSIATVNAEATLRFAECGLEGGCAGATWTAAGFLRNSAGLFTLDSTIGSTVNAQSPNSSRAGVKWSAPAGNSLSYAGPTLRSGGTPQYAIEKLPPVIMPGDTMSAEQYNGGGGATPYQITAYANGADTNSQSVLQSTFRP